MFDCGGLTFDIPSVEGVPIVRDDYFQEMLEELRAMDERRQRRPNWIKWGAAPNENAPVTRTSRISAKDHEDSQEEMMAAQLEGALECLKLCEPFLMEIWSPWQCESILKGVLGLRPVPLLSIGWEALRSMVHREGDFSRVPSISEACQLASPLTFDVPEEQSAATLRGLVSMTGKLRSILIGQNIHIARSHKRESLEVDIQGISLVEQFQAINALFATAPCKITMLSLPDARFKDEMEEHLTALKDCTTLEDVTLSPCVEFNFFPKSRLKLVHLLFHRQQTARVFKTLSAALLAQRGLEELHVGLDVGVDLNDPAQLAHFAAFGDALRQHGLRKLSFYGLAQRRSTNTNPQLAAGCLVRLFSVIGQSRVEELDLSGEMWLDMNGLAQGLGVLEQNATLKTLFVSSIGSNTDEEMDCVGAALERNLSVTRLEGFCFWFPPFPTIVRRNELLAKARSGMGVVLEAAGDAALPHLLSKLGSNQGEGTPLFALLRFHSGECIEAKPSKRMLKTAGSSSKKQRM